MLEFKIVIDGAGGIKKENMNSNVLTNSIEDPSLMKLEAKDEMEREYFENNEVCRSNFM